MGYNEVNGVQEYNNASLRNVRVVRVDSLYYMKEYFSDSTIVKSRNAIYYILAGYGIKDNRELVVSSIEDLYKKDDVFKVKLGKIVYFRDVKLEGLSVYDALLEDARISIEMAWKEIFSITPYVKFICDTKLYLYFSVNNILRIEDLLQIKGLEVISR